MARWNKLNILFDNISFDFIKCESVKEKEFCANENAIGFPTLNFYIDGALKDEYTGSDDTAEFQRFLNEYLEIKSLCNPSSKSERSQHLSEKLLN